MTVGNVGFFDVGGEALDQPRNRYLFTLTQTSGIAIHYSGAYGELLRALPKSKELVFSTMLRIKKRMRQGFTVHVEQNLPVRKGSGASAAARSAVRLALSELIGPRVGRLDIVAQVAREEGHWDNVAACILGGFVYIPSEQKVIRHGPIPDLEELVVIPPVEKASTDLLRRSIADYRVRSETAVEALEKAGIVFVSTGSLNCERKMIRRLVHEVTQDIPSTLRLMETKNEESVVNLAKKLLLRLNGFAKCTQPREERLRSFGLGSINDFTHTQARADIGAYGPYKHYEFLELSKRILKHGGYLRISGAGPNHIIAYDGGKVTPHELLSIKEEEYAFWEAKGFNRMDLKFLHTRPSRIGARVTVSS